MDQVWLLPQLQPPKRSIQMANSCIKVGIDFGTTYSGVAWLHTSNCDEINVLQSWPHGGRRESDKVPTEIVYGSSFGQYGYKWGFEAEQYPNKITWPKLLLDPSQELRTPNLTPVLRRIRTLLPPDKRPVDVVADYLAALKRHLKDALVRRYGEGLMENIQVEYVLTVPAVWSDGAKALTLEAAERAGFGSRGCIQLISEPEAAAVYSIPSIQPNYLQVGDTFIVADCGGGTVDLISYQILQLSPTLKVKEHAVGGEVCGSTFINRSFEVFVSQRIGEQYLTMRPKARMHMFRAFDDLKKIVSEGDGETSYSIPTPGLKDDETAGIDEGWLILTKKDIKTIFDPVVDQVVELVQQQVTIVEASGKGRASGVLLVGGFGSSEYLREQLTNRIKSRANNSGIQVLRPSNSWTAVVRGAVLRSIEALAVTHRLARYHYGVKVQRAFVAGQHPEAHKFWCSSREQWRCGQLASWFITKGAEVKDEEKIKHGYHHIFPTNYEKGWITDAIYVSAKAMAPDSIQDSSVKQLCTFKIDLRDIPAYHFKAERSASGIPYQTLSLNLIMKIKSAQLIFSMEVGGVEYCNVKAKFV